MVKSLKSIRQQFPTYFYTFYCWVEILCHYSFHIQVIDGVSVMHVWEKYKKIVDLILLFSSLYECEDRKFFFGGRNSLSFIRLLSRKHLLNRFDTRFVNHLCRSFWSNESISNSSTHLQSFVQRIVASSFQCKAINSHQPILSREKLKIFIFYGPELVKEFYLSAKTNPLDWRHGAVTIEHYRKTFCFTTK